MRDLRAFSYENDGLADWMKYSGWGVSAAPVTAPTVQDAGGVGIHQDGEAIAKSIGIIVDDDSALGSDTASQNAAKTEQGTAAAYLTAFSSAVADDLAVGTEDSFQKRNGAQKRLPSVTVFHKKPCY